ncbi:hypothetical protein E4U42_003187 [Claviceps africana]|uniref:Uncharacterized protein n=1 Tax=Claviceps africana TaxID=83212 RepID=A0A8K0NJ77_9HYPO|nr:hypothetical protein E4U42_003187 [Claviceps africana]
MYDEVPSEKYFYKGGTYSALKYDITSIVRNEYSTCKRNPMKLFTKMSTTMSITSLLCVLLTAMVSVGSASPNILPLGVEIMERDGITMVREVSSNPAAESASARAAGAGLEMEAATRRTLPCIARGVVIAAVRFAFERARPAIRLAGAEKLIMDKHFIMDVAPNAQQWTLNV